MTAKTTPFYYLTVVFWLFFKKDDLILNKNIFTINSLHGPNKLFLSGFVKCWPYRNKRSTYVSLRFEHVKTGDKEKIFHRQSSLIIKYRVVKKFLKFVLKGTTEKFFKLIKMRFFVSKRFVNIIFTDGNTEKRVENL